MDDAVWWILRFSFPVLFFLGKLFGKISEKWIYKIVKSGGGYYSGGTEGEWVPPYTYTVEVRGCISLLALIVSIMLYLGAIVGGMAWFPIIVSLIQDNWSMLVRISVFIVGAAVAFSMICLIIWAIMRFVWELFHPPK